MNKDGGYTLVEFLIAAALSLGLVITVVSIYSSIKQHYLYADQLVRINEDAQAVFSVLAHDIRLAGFADCQPLSHSIAIGHQAPKSIQAKVKPGTDVITVYRASSHLLSWQEFMRHKWRKDSRFVVSNCQGSQVVSLAILTSSSDHSVAISPYVENTYYIADTHRHHRDGRNIYSLYVKPLHWPSLELIEDALIMKAKINHAVVSLHLQLTSRLAVLHRSFDTKINIRNSL